MLEEDEELALITLLSDDPHVALRADHHLVDPLRMPGPMSDSTAPHIRLSGREATSQYPRAYRSAFSLSPGKKKTSGACGVACFGRDRRKSGRTHSGDDGVGLVLQRRFEGKVHVVEVDVLIRVVIPAPHQVENLQSAFLSCSVV